MEHWWRRRSNFLVRFGIAGFAGFAIGLALRAFFSHSRSNLTPWWIATLTFAVVLLLGLAIEKRVPEPTPGQTRWMILLAVVVAVLLYLVALPLA